MIHKVIGIIKRVNRPNGFQAYMNNVHRSDLPGAGPTYDEARKDYQSISRQA